MRNRSKALACAVALLATGLLSSSVSANNDLLAGSFTLSQPIQWKNTQLPAGSYTLKLSRTQTDKNLLSVRGKNQALDILVFAQSACSTCKNSAITLENGSRVVSSLDLPGFRVNFNNRPSASQREQEGRKAPAKSEQVAIQINPN